VTRPVWEPDARTLRLHAQAEALAKRIGIPLPHRSAGGGSDGNFTGAIGVPTLDGLGVLGGSGHTLEEHVLIDSLMPRGRLLAGLLATLDSG
jgi:glutamate carboxypeptidase